jgi:dipeptidase D
MAGHRRRQIVDSTFTSLAPQPLWSYFAQLSRIPRGSKAEAEAAAWVAEQGRALGLESEQDEAGNVLIRKPATPGREGRPGVALQAHVDMVCEKNEGTVHDFTRDPIRLVLDGDLVRAEGTTLGADNGIGVAAGLAVMAAQGLRHGPLELLVTVDEETGLTGADRLRPGWLRSAMLLNLDSEEEGILTIGCAGGADSIATRKLSPATLRAGSVPQRLKVSGLHGGHSGIDINGNRGNAIRILAQVLQDLAGTIPFQLGAVKGGNKRNAIPREASATLYLTPAELAACRTRVVQLEAQWRASLGAFEPQLAIALVEGKPSPALADQDAQALIRLLLALPHGVEAMSPDIPGLVQTSTNLGVVETGEVARVNLLSRSSVDADKTLLAARIAAACAGSGFGHALENVYPGWKPEPGSDLVRLMDRVHQATFGRPMTIQAIHAGLECGIIGKKYPGMQMVSFGPDMAGVHTPDEHVSVASVANFWKLLLAVLEAA